MTKAELCYQLMAAVWDTDFETAPGIEDARVVATALGGVDTGKEETESGFETPAFIWLFPDGSKLAIGADGGNQSRLEEKAEAA